MDANSRRVGTTKTSDVDVVTLCIQGEIVRPPVARTLSRRDLRNRNKSTREEKNARAVISGDLVECWESANGEVRIDKSGYYSHGYSFHIRNDWWFSHLCWQEFRQISSMTRASLIVNFILFNIYVHWLCMINWFFLEEKSFRNDLKKCLATERFCERKISLILFLNCTLRIGKKFLFCYKNI